MFPVAAMEVFRDHHGLATAALLSQAGVSRRSRHAAVESGAMELLYERVYRIASAPVTLESRCAALCLAYGRCFVTGPTYGRLLNLRRMPKDERIHVASPHGSHIGPFDDVVLRQTTKSGREFWRQRSDGLRLATPARLAFDLAADLSPIDHRSVVEQLRADRLLSDAQLVDIGRVMIHPARPGSRVFAQTLWSITGPAVDSHPEIIVYEGLRDRGVPVVKQQGLMLPNGRRIRIDMAVPEVRWAVEVDVHPDHLLLDGTTRDKRRDRSSHRIDWQVERVTELDLLTPSELLDELVELYHMRVAALSGRRSA